MVQIENGRAILAVRILSVLGVVDDYGSDAGMEIGTAKRAHCKSQVK
jgi:hypothetical protein